MANDDQRLVDWDTILSQAKSSKTNAGSPKRRSTSSNWLIAAILGVIAVCVVAATCFFVVLPVVFVSTVATSVAKSTAMDQERFDLVGPVSHELAFIGPLGRETAGYRFQLTVVNKSEIAVDFCKVYMRVKRPARPLPDYEFSDLARISGGIGPGESLSISAEAPDILGRTADQYEESVVEVSVDGKIWFPSRLIKARKLREND